jgi:hypothetical protein
MRVDLEFVIPPNEVCTGAYFAAARIDKTSSKRPEIRGNTAIPRLARS